MATAASLVTAGTSATGIALLGIGAELRPAGGHARARRGRQEAPARARRRGRGWRRATSGFDGERAVRGRAPPRDGRLRRRGRRAADAHRPAPGTAARRSTAMATSAATTCRCHLPTTRAHDEGAHAPQLQQLREPRRSRIRSSSTPRSATIGELLALPHARTTLGRTYPFDQIEEAMAAVGKGDGKPVLLPA